MHAVRRKVHGWRERIRARRGWCLAYRILVGIIGTVIVVGGLAMVPLPGPGWLIVFLGLAILGSEFAWAKRLELWVRGVVGVWIHWITRQNLLVRSLIGLATMAFVVGVVYAVLVVYGIPEWVSEEFVPPLPGLTN
ncbi:MAG: hypothetical protein QG608_1872 [Actinomycetota bacterium]|nr:hypothetical protein [Actinomycetota bacterium]